LTKDGPPAWWFGRGVTTPYHKEYQLLTECYIALGLGIWLRTGTSGGLL